MEKSNSGDFCLSDEFVLSDRIRINQIYQRNVGKYYRYKNFAEEDVKEFVRLLKVQIDISSLISRGVKNNLISKVRKLAGGKLTDRKTITDLDVDWLGPTTERMAGEKLK